MLQSSARTLLGLLSYPPHVYIPWAFPGSRSIELCSLKFYRRPRFSSGACFFPLLLSHFTATAIAL
jgi:hypothetical protein